MSRLRVILSLTLAVAGVVSAQQPTARSPKTTVSREEAALHKQAKVSEAAATATALAAVPGSRVKSSELEQEDGKLIWTFDLTVPGKTGIEEVNVDALTGKVIGTEHEDVKAEKAEARQDARRPKTQAKKPTSSL